jgi:diguanylate cyclase (GGDEF)-like protein/PAS domain S-box-containing protein
MKSPFSLSRSLKTRVTLFTLAIFSVSLWTLSFYASRMLQEDMQRVLGEQQFLTASRVAAKINEELVDRLAALELIGKNIDADLIGNPTALQARMEQRPILSIMFNGGAWVSGQDGVVVASNLPPLIGANYADREYLVTVLKGGKSAISKPITGKVFKDPTVVMAVPIRDAAGKVIGAIAGVIDLGKANFLDGTAKSPYGKSGGFLLNSPQYRLIVTATDKSRIMQPLPPPGTNKLLDHYMQGHEGYGVSVNSRGVEELTAAKAIPVAGWFMGVVVPTAEAFAPVYDMQQRMLWATLLLTLLAGGLIWWVLRMQLEPILNTARTMARMATAKQPVQALPITHRDEIGDMIAGFNHLLEVLGHREAALTESEQRWRFAIEGAGDGLWDWNVPQSTVFFNTRWKEMLGFSQEEIGTSLDEWSKRVHPDDLARVMTDVQAHLDGLTPVYVNEHRVNCKDGSWKWILDRGLVVSHDAMGKPLRVIGTHADISERKLIAEKMDTLMREQKAILQNNVVGIVTVRHRRIIWANPALEALLGYGPGELAGTPTDPIYLSEQDFLDFGASVYPVLAEGKVFRSQREYRRKDGTFVWVDVSGSLINPSDGVSLWVFADISKTKMIAEQIAQSEAALRDLFDAALDAVISMDVQGQITGWNRQAESMFGWSNQEAMGMTLHDTIAPPKHRAAHHVGFKRFLATGQGEILGRRIELTALRRSGEEFPVELSILPFKQNGIHHFTAFVADISARKLTEELVRRLAYYDPLTGLANRTLLKDRLSQSMVASDRSRHYGALLFIDLDNFKPVNDLHGHDAGDLVLTEAARRLTSCVRQIDTVSRIGGDEFVVLLDDLAVDRVQSQLQAGLLAKKVRDRLADPYTLDHYINETQPGHRIKHQCSASIGVVLFLGSGHSEDEILKSADAAMYQAKNMGGNRVFNCETPQQ